MNFHEFPLFYVSAKRLGMVPRGVSSAVFYANHFRDMHCIGTSAEAEVLGVHLFMEGWWAEHNRPFYNVWPKIIPMLTRLDLSQITGKMLKSPKQVMCLRVPQEGNPLTRDGVTLRSMLVGPVSTTAGHPAYFTAQDYGETISGLPVVSTNWVPLRPDQPLLETFGGCKKRESAMDGIQIPEELMLDVWRLVFTLSLLDDDPELIERIVLAADRNDYDRSGDQKYVAKAERRGVLGWDIGKRVEVMPHYRRPHLGLRWTGEGRTVAKIVPIKGAIIHREAVLQQPTGEEGPVDVSNDQQGDKP